MPTSRETKAHPDFIEAIEALGPKGRIFVVGHKEGRPTRTTSHKPVPEAQEYIRRDALANKQDGGYSYVYFGVKAFHHAESGAWLPYPPEGEDDE
jgi:hypothetical protein